uniref:Reverse transcriptase domain-containing protein n=1 Tax=Strongyloides papillosus TaxID=174720 RepID=A0A0N5C6B5_STREA
MPEEDRITFLWQHVPALWQEELLDELVENDDSLSSVAIFDYLDKKISDTMKLEPLKEKLCENHALPTYDKIHTFVTTADLKHSERSHFKKDIDRKKDDTNIIKNKIKKMEPNNEIKKVFSKTFHKSDTASDTIVKKGPTIIYAKQNLCADNKGLICKGLVQIEDVPQSFEFGIDPCAEVNTIPLSIFKTLPSHIQDKLVVDERTTRYFDTFLTIENTHVVKQPAKIHVDPAASLPLICYSFLMKVQLNPLTITKIMSHDNLEVDKFGCSYGRNFNHIKDFMSEPESRILVDKSFELGNVNVIDYDFEIKQPFDPKITRIIPLPSLIKDSVKNMLDQELSLGWLRKLDDSKTVFNTNPMVVVSKHQGEIRICFSYSVKNMLDQELSLGWLRKLDDSETVFNTNPMVVVPKHQGEIRICFSCKHQRNFCYFEPQTLAFGVSIAPYIWYEYITSILEEFKQHIEIYMDDIIVKAPAMIHESVVLGILGKLREFNLKLSTHKCFFGVTRGEFIEFSIDLKKGIQIPYHKMLSLLQLPIPETGRELKKTLAKINYFTSNIPNFALPAQPLYPFQNVKGSIRKDIEPMFKSLPESTSNAILLTPLKSGVKKLVITAATNGKAILSTMNVQYETSQYPIAIYGRVLRNSEVNYAYPTKLLLSIREIIYDNLLIASVYPILVLSDVKNLVREIILPKIAYNTHQRIMTDLLPFSIEYKYLNTKENIVSLMSDANLSESLLTSNCTSDKSYDGDFFCYCVPLLTVSDNALCFNSDAFLQFMDQLGCTHIFSVPRKSERNGVAERHIEIVKEGLYKFIQEGKTFVESLRLSTIKAQQRIFKDGRSCHDIFFNINYDIQKELIKYSNKNILCNIKVLFKKERSDKLWTHGTCIEQISEQLYRILAIDNLIYLRTRDSIQFPDRRVKGEDEEMTDNSSITIKDGDCSSERGKPDDEHVFVDLEGESDNERFSISSHISNEQLSVDEMLDNFSAAEPIVYVQMAENVDGKLDRSGKSLNIEPILLQPNESSNTILSEGESVFHDQRISGFDFGTPLEFERTLEQRDLKANCKLDATPNLFNSDDELEEYIKENKVKILAGVDGSALIDRGTGYTIEWCETGHSVDGGEKMGNASSPQLCEIKALRLCLDHLIELKNTSTLPKGEVLVLSDSSYLVDGVNLYLESWFRNNFVKLDGKPLKHCDEWRSIHYLLSKLKCVNIKRVPAHKKIRINEKADCIAKSFATSNWTKKC